jgi:two-component system response regulator RpaA
MTDILVVDDDDIVAQTIERTLQRHQFDVQVARSGVEALKIIRRHPPALMILDVLMPGMNGYEICQEIRRDPRLADLPILFLTARGKHEDVVQGFTAGGDDYLTKPFNIEELILRVKAILRRTQGQPVAPGQRLDRLTVGNVQLDSRSFQIHLPHGTFSLTPVQFDLVYHLMIHAGEVFSTYELLRDVWDYPYDTGSPDLVRVHIKNLRQRMEPDPNHPVYIRTIPGHGYTFFSGGAANE